jgi:BirA family biotin operon repressor/biotin-[acetyl-CoA-carboxylase] ligase
MAAVAMADAVQDVSGLSPQIKWPNDLVVDAGRDPVTGTWRRKKLAGILTEAAMSGAQVQHVVVGVGINLQPTAYPPDVVATSILSETQVLVEPGELFAACRASLARDYATWTGGGAASVLERWRRRAPSITGCPVKWQQDGRELRGVSAGVDDEGALLIRGDAGQLHRVVAGEVEWA